MSLEILKRTLFWLCGCGSDLRGSDECVWFVPFTMSAYVLGVLHGEVLGALLTVCLHFSISPLTICVEWLLFGITTFELLASTVWYCCELMIMSCFGKEESIQTFLVTTGESSLLWMGGQVWQWILRQKWEKYENLLYILVSLWVVYTQRQSNLLF